MSVDPPVPPPWPAPPRPDGTAPSSDGWLTLVLALVVSAGFVAFDWYTWVVSLDRSVGRAFVLATLPFALPLVYAVGAGVYMLLTGRRPFARPSRHPRWGAVFLALFTLTVVALPFAYLYGFLPSFLYEVDLPPR